jgi:dihydroxy-acid dehydratase
MLRAVGFVRRRFREAAGRRRLDLEQSDALQHAHRRAGASGRERRRAGRAAKAVTFNTITVSDGISMGTPGMRYSLVSREVIADSIETVVGAQGFDGVVAIGGCDKNMPGCMMALARLDRPAVFVYGGTILPGADKRDIVSVFEAVGGRARGTVSDSS